MGVLSHHRAGVYYPIGDGIKIYSPCLFLCMKNSVLVIRSSLQLV